MPDRRTFLAAAGALAGSLIAARGAATDGRFVNIGRLAAARGIRFGFALDPRRLTDDPRYGAFVAEQATIVVPENALKWANVHPAAKDYDFSQADSIAAFARVNGIALRGHTFC